MKRVGSPSIGSHESQATPDGCCDAQAASVAVFP